MKIRLPGLLSVSCLCVAAPLSAQTNVITVRPDAETRAALREMTADHWVRRDALFSTLLGGALATLGGFGAIGLADLLEARRKRRDDIEFADNALRAIHRELKAVSEVYDSGVGKHLKETAHDQPFPYYFAMTQDFFTVFNSNSAHLGRITPDLSRRIITVYVRMKHLIEQFKINNVYIEAAARLEAEAQSLSEDPEGMKNIPRLVPRDVQLRKMRVESTAILKGIDEQLKKDTDELFVAFAERGIK